MYEPEVFTCYEIQGLQLEYYKFFKNENCYL